VSIVLEQAAAAAAAVVTLPILPRPTFQVLLEEEQARLIMVKLLLLQSLEQQAVPAH
jgi:hypothetical protein